MMCFKCMRGAHTLCENNTCEDCHGSQELNVGIGTDIDLSMSALSEGEGDTDEDSDREYGYEDTGLDNPSYKIDSALIDPQSTGRKRAAKLFPMDPTAPCEWRGMVNPGSSIYPIPDCIDGLQEARHHGPDYNTLNNSVGNVHRICHFHHNNWHALNDAMKSESYLKLYGHKFDKDALSKSAKLHKSGATRKK